jgi:HEPN domain-containing protein
MGRLGAGVSEQHAASYRRWEDADVLMRAERWRGAMYMAGYSLECALKATLMREWGVTNLGDLEDVLRQQHASEGSLFTHDLERLFSLTRLGGAVMGNPSPTPYERQIMRWFRACNGWVVAWRYSGSIGARNDCERMLSAVEALVRKVRAST